MPCVKVLDKFGRWLVLEVVGTTCKVQCDCGAVKTVQSGGLVRGATKSCGCLKRELQASRYKGVKQYPEYAVWCSMISRCTNANQKSYPRYGGRGISVCDEWRNGDGTKSGFECFIGSVGRRPDKSYSIERIDNSGNYEPSNCKWATKAEQDRNKRDNHWVVFRGQRMILADAIRLSGLAPKLAENRLRRGWPLEKALATEADAYDQDRMIFVEVDGKKMNLKAAAKAAGIKYHTVYARVRAGWPIEKALTFKR